MTHQGLGATENQSKFGLFSKPFFLPLESSERVEKTRSTNTPISSTFNCSKKLNVEIHSIHTLDVCLACSHPQKQENN